MASPPAEQIRTLPPLHRAWATKKDGAGQEGISIIVPSYNEEAGIGQTLDELREAMNQAGLLHEIIVVDDGSTDRTAEIAAAKGVRLIKHPQNKGYGAALKTGMRHAAFDIIAITDADATYPNMELPRLIEHLCDSDMVVGARTGENVRISLLRWPTKWVLTQLANYLTGVNIPDLNSGLRVFRKGVALEFFKILPSGFSFTATLTLAMLTNDYVVKFVPVDYRHRLGRSKIHPVKDTLNFFSLIVRTVMYYNPLKVFMPASLFFILIGLAKTSYDAIVLRDLATSDLLLLITGALIGMLGLLADLIEKRS